MVSEEFLETELLTGSHLSLWETCGSVADDTFAPGSSSSVRDLEGRCVGGSLRGGVRPGRHDTKNAVSGDYAVAALATLVPTVFGRVVECSTRARTLVPPIDRNSCSMRFFFVAGRRAATDYVLLGRTYAADSHNAAAVGVGATNCSLVG